MIMRELDGIPVLQSQRLLDVGVSHGWFGAALGNTMLRDSMVPEEMAAVMERWEHACRALGMDVTKLVKTTGLLQTEIVQVVGPDDAGKTIGEADGYTIAMSDVPVLLRAADCMQIIMYEPRAKVMGLIHAGGRGVSTHVIRNTLQRMVESSADPSKVLVAIGPAIAPEHFVPTMEVDHFTLSDIQAANPVGVTLPDGRIGYDIVATACQEFARLGIVADNIEVSGIDTFSSREFYSSERDRIVAPEASLYRNGLVAMFSN